MKKQSIFILVIINLVCLLSFNMTHTNAQSSSFDCTTVTQIPQAECEALIVIYGNGIIAGPDNDWFSNTTPCSWYGLACDSTNSTIVGLFLNLSYITSLPPEIGNLPNLEDLHLTLTSVRNLPPEIGELTKLKTLDIGHTFITELPPEIGNLSDLEVLRADYANLSSLPPEIGNLTTLVDLDLFDNRLTELPSEIGNLSNLETLDLRFNNLTNLPSEITNLTPNWLNVNYNPLCIEDPAVVQWLNDYHTGTSVFEVCERLAVTLQNSAAESPRSNTAWITMLSGLLLLGTLPILSRR